MQIFMLFYAGIFAILHYIHLYMKMIIRPLIHKKVYNEHIMLPIFISLSNSSRSIYVKLYF